MHLRIKSLVKIFGSVALNLPNRCWLIIANKRKVSVIGIDELRVQIDTLIDDISEFLSKRKFKHPSIPNGPDKEALYSVMQMKVRQSKYTSRLFVSKFHKRVLNVGYELRKHKFLDEKEWQHFKHINLSDYSEIEWVLQALEYYRAKLT